LREGGLAIDRQRRGEAHLHHSTPMLDIDGALVPLTLRINRRARRLIVRVMHQSGEVVVVAPSRRALKDAVGFAQSQRHWIAARLKEVPPPMPFAPGGRVPVGGAHHTIVHRPAARAGVFLDADLLDGNLICVSGELAHLPRRTEDFLKREARSLMLARTAAHCRSLGLAIPRVVLRDPSTRWGSCSETSGISYSWRLIMAPPHVADYVAAHEVAHLIHMDHSRAFWRLLGAMVPDARGPIGWLASEGRALHRYGARRAHSI
jgi:predicted metal-dependent hydrolase